MRRTLCAVGLPAGFFLLASLAVAADEQVPTSGAALLERYRQLQAIQVRIVQDAGNGRDPGVATLTYRRPDRYRIDYGPGPNHRVVACDGRGIVDWRPERKGFFRSTAPEESDATPRWDGFSNLPNSLLTLLQPTPAEQRLLERGWAPRLFSAGEGPVGNESCFRLRGWARFGAPLELWVSRRDGLIRQIEIGPLRGIGQPARQVRFEIVAVNEAVPGRAVVFNLPPGARDLRQRAPRPQPRQGVNLQVLEQRVAANPRDSKALGVLLRAYQQAGERGLAVLMSVRILRAARTPAEAQAALDHWNNYTALHAALYLFAESAQRFGNKIELSVLTYGWPLRYWLRQVRYRAPLRRRLEAVIARHADAWSARVLLGQLQLLDGEPAAALDHLLRLIERAGADLPEAVLGGLASSSGFLAQLSNALLPEDRPRLLAALSNLEDRLPADRLIPVYLRLNDLAAAERLYEQADPTRLGSLQIGHLAAATWDAGNRPAAQQRFREAMALAVTDQWIDYNSLAYLLALPHAREALAPVLRQLAEVEKSNPLQSAHWLAIAGDLALAARRYEEYLVSEAGSPRNAPAMRRLSAAMIGAWVAERAGNLAAAERLAIIALEEAPFARVEAYPGQWVTPQILWLIGSITNADLRERILDRAAESDGEAIARDLLRGYWYAGELTQAETQALLKRLFRTGLPHLSPRMAEQLFHRGLKDEFAQWLERRLRDAPLSAPLRLLTNDQFGPETTSRLLSVLESAVQSHPEWHDGLRTLVSLCRSQPERARPHLLRLAAGARTAAEFKLLGELETNLGQPSRALDHYRRASRLQPKDLNLQMALAEALEAANRRQEALAAWRQLQSRVSWERAAQVATHLRQLGAKAEALRLLEKSYATARLDAPRGGRLTSLKAELAESYLQSGQADRAISLYPEVALFDEMPDVMSADGMNLHLPPGVWTTLVDRLEKQRKYEAAVTVLMSAQASGTSQIPASQVDRLLGRVRATGQAQGVCERAEEMAQRRPLPEMLLLLAKIQAAADRGVEALRTCRRLLLPSRARLPHLSAAAPDVCQTYAALLQSAGSADEAVRIRRYGEAFALALGAGKTADPEESRRQLAEARRLFPDSPCLIFRQTAVLSGEEAVSRWREGVVALTRAVVGWESCESCRSYASLVDQAAGDLPGALALGDPAGAACLEAWRAASGPAPDRRRSLQLWLKATQLAPDLAIAWQNLARAYEELGEPLPAARTAYRAAELLDDDSVAWVRASDLCRRAGLRAEARAANARANGLDPAAGADVDELEVPVLAPDERRLLQFLSRSGWYDSQVVVGDS